MRRLLGLRDLVHDAVEKTTDLVETTQRSALRRPVRALSLFPSLRPSVRAVDGAVRFGTSGVCTSVRLTNRAVQQVTDAMLAVARATGLDERALDPLPVPASPIADSAQGILNAVIGDYLEHKGNGLQVEMAFFQRGRPLSLEPLALAQALPNASDTVCIFVHGLACTERSWRLRAEQLHGDARVTLGSLLEQHQGLTPLYVRYNSGRHISDNGRALARLLESLVSAYPKPVRQVVIVGHSMGGLVARSAVHYAGKDQARWVEKLTHVICLGSPHHGTHLERAGNVLSHVLSKIDLASTQVPAKIINGRSAGIKDLRFGNVVEEDWAGHEPDAFLRDGRTRVPHCEHVTYCSIAATASRDPKHPLSGLLGDLLVHVDSASGHARDETRRIPFHVGRVLGGVRHFDLLNHPDVVAEVQRVLTSQ